MSDTPGVGRIAWTDLTVGNAEQVRDFYREVAGWQPQPVEMGGYSDYSMLAPDGTPAAGICHARGVNAALPPQWLVYIAVADVDAAAARCVGLGGELVVAPRNVGGGRFCVIRDPAGAVAGLWQG